MAVDGVLLMVFVVCWRTWRVRVVDQLFGYGSVSLLRVSLSLCLCCSVYRTVFAVCLSCLSCCAFVYPLTSVKLLPAVRLKWIT